MDKGVTLNKSVPSRGKKNMAPKTTNATKLKKQIAQGILQNWGTSYPDGGLAKNEKEPEYPRRN